MSNIISLYNKDFEGKFRKGFAKKDYNFVSFTHTLTYALQNESRPEYFIILRNYLSFLVAVIPKDKATISIYLNHMNAYIIPKIISYRDKEVLDFDEAVNNILQPHKSANVEPSSGFTGSITVLLDNFADVRSNAKFMRKLLTDTLKAYLKPNSINLNPVKVGYPTPPNLGDLIQKRMNVVIGELINDINSKQYRPEQNNLINKGIKISTFDYLYSVFQELNPKPIKLDKNLLTK